MCYLIVVIRKESSNKNESTLLPCYGKERGIVIHTEQKISRIGIFLSANSKKNYKYMKIKIIA
jgi:hypothetical protein